MWLLERVAAVRQQMEAHPAGKCRMHMEGDKDYGENWFYRNGKYRLCDHAKPAEQI